MRLLSILIVSNLIISTLFAKEVPIMREIDINIPLKEYSIVEFPFKIKGVQFTTFTYKKKVKTIDGVEVDEKKEVEPINTKKKIRLSRKEKKSQDKQKRALEMKEKKNLLGIERGDNVMTFKPKFLGKTEMIIWGYEDFPIVINLNVEKPKNADKFIQFKKPFNKRSQIKKFEANPHEQIIEKITKYLYTDKAKFKPSGYRDVVRKELYEINLKDRNQNIYGVVRCTLVREIEGHLYKGQVWNINLLSYPTDKKSKLETTNYQPSKNEDILNNTKLNLYEEMFDEDGIFAVSLETYSITKDNGTRVIIVRNNQKGINR